MLKRPPAGSIPDTPGSYQFKDKDGRVIYVGKAHSLRSRLSNYFVNPSSLPARTAQMVAAAESVEWIQVRNDVEALMLEYSLIKQHRPRFNIRLRDDKSYPFLAVTVGDEWPRARVMRGKKRKDTRYFGPFGHAYAIRETLDLLLRTFPIRTCSDNKFDHHARLGRPCLLFHIEKCKGPCVGEVDHEEYDRLVGQLMEFLEGDTEPIVRQLEVRMREASDALEFERAARLRDRLASVRKAVEKQTIVTERPEDLDVIGMAGDELEVAVQVFFVRRGRVVGRKGFVLDLVEDVSQAELVGRVLEGLYAEADAADVPREVLVPDEPADADVYREFLCELKGSKVAIRIPQRGDKRALQATVTQNAKEEFVRHRLKRASDHNARARALNALQDALDLPDAPLRIECYDMSHIQGSDYVGSMVVMEDGLTKKSDYRRFKIRDVPGNDDFAAMEEVLTRRLTALIVERDQVGGRRRRRHPAEEVRIPAEPAARRRWEGPAQRRPPGRGDARPRGRDLRRRPGQAVRGGLRARPSRPGPNPPPVGGPLPAPTAPRRGPPLRHLVPPRAPGQADDHERPRRDRRPRPDPQEAAGQGAGRHAGGEVGDARAAAGADVAARRRRPGRVRQGAQSGARRMTDPDLWEQHAGWWQDAFTDGADAEYTEQILPMAAANLVGAEDVLDVGTGEGQVARLAVAGGARRVVGVDPAWAQLDVARQRSGGAAYVRAGAAALPFAGETFDAVVACLVFEHIDDVDGAIAEVGRVLRPGGRFLYFLNHPLLQAPGSGWIDDHILEEQYWRIGPYLVEDTSLEEVEKDVFLPFVHRPLSRYVNAMAANGMVIRRMEEPPPPPGFLARAQEYRDAATIPRLLFLRAEKLA